ncbi:hypothetical protein [Granulicella sp. L46]|jgi:hypothetical protein|uniref:hypothetical protein n=1 Tax=Granulicella sp. L46 TaxID=1641865 RepID=UPI00131BA596|nr:hypothetical protein [Granulicella sp. L46]
MTYLIPQYPVHLVRNDSAVAVAFLAVIPQGSASSFALAVASAFAFAPEIGPGFSPDIPQLLKAWALAPGTLSWGLAV